MPWDQKIVPDAFLVAALSAAGSAADGARSAAYMAHIQTGIGTSWRRQLLRNDVVVYEGTGSGLIPFSGLTFTVPAVTKASISSADIDTGEWVHRVINASDATKYVANLVTPTGGAGPGFLTGDLVSPNDVSWGSFTMQAPVLDSLSIALGAPTDITTSGFTLTAVISGAVPPGAVMRMQWIGNRATDPWRESPIVPAAPGTYTVTFTGAPADTLITWRVFVYTLPDIIHAQSAEGTLRTAVAVSSGWLDFLRDSMTVVNVTERFRNTGDFREGRIISADGVWGVQFPDSYATSVSFEGMRSANAGRPVSFDGAGNPVFGDIDFFARNVNCGVVWMWFAAKQGHASTQARIRVSDCFFSVLRESTRQWELVYSGARAHGDNWIGDTGQLDYSAMMDLSSDPNATYIRPFGSVHPEVWPEPTVANPGGISRFVGRIDRERITDMRSWVIGYKVRVEGPDRALSRFVSVAGIDMIAAGTPRYWPSGYWRGASDAGGGEWQNLRTDGVDQWICAVGCFELGRFQGIRPPWGNWGGSWPFASPPRNGASWAEIQANPPPDYRLL